MLYAVCTNCTFLRAFSRRARPAALEHCPACGGELIIQRKAGRFEPAYVSRVILDLHAVPALDERGGETAMAPPDGVQTA